MIRRLASAVPTLFIIIAIAFFMIRLAPGGPFDRERVVPPEISANLNRVYHLDEPLPQQFIRYLKGLARGDFGPSFKYRDFTVTELIATGFPVSLKIGLLAMVAAVLLGVGLGAWAARRRNSVADHLVMGLAMTGIAVPSFVVAPLLSLVIGVYLNLLPVGGLGDGGVRHLLLPVISLALPQVAYIARLSRGSMLEVLNADFIRTGRAQGAHGTAHRLPPRPQERADAGGVLPRAGHRGHRHRLGGHRADLRDPGPRPLLRPGRPQPRLHAGDGRRGHLRRPHHRPQSRGRPALRCAGPTGAP